MWGGGCTPLNAGGLAGAYMGAAALGGNVYSGGDDPADAGSSNAGEKEGSGGWSSGGGLAEEQDQGGSGGSSGGGLAEEQDQEGREDQPADREMGELPIHLSELLHYSEEFAWHKPVRFD